MRRIAALSTLILIAAAAAAAAQAQRAGRRALERHLFPPELVMTHQQEIALGEDQRDAIKAAVGEAQATIHDLQWDLQAEFRSLEDLLAAETVDEAAALERAARVMDLEHRIKKTHLQLAIRIKNQLNSEQQARLRELRPRDRPHERYRERSRDR